MEIATVEVTECIAMDDMQKASIHSAASDHVAINQLHTLS